MTLLVDKLCLSLIFLLKAKEPKEIIYLDPATTMYRVLFSTLRAFGIVVRELDFCLGDIDRSSNSNLYIKGVQLANFLSRDVSSKIIKNNYLDVLNQEFNRNTLQLHLAKCYQHELLEFCQKVVFLQVNLKDHQRIFIQKPYFLSWEYIENSDQFKGIQFYSSMQSNVKSIISLLNRFTRIMLLHLYVVLRSRIQPLNFSVSKTKNVILSPREDTISSNPGSRNQQFWTTGADEDNVYYVLDGGWKFSRFSSVSQFGNTQVLPQCIVGMALRKYSQDSRLDSVRRPLFRPILKNILTGNMANIFVYVNLLILLRRSIEIGSIALFLNVKGYVFKETHNVQTDAIQLVSDKIGVITYAIQYSNLLIKNCLMASTADKYLIFSDMYKSTFSDKYFSPREFVVIGYPYREVLKYIKKPAMRIKDSLKELGASLIIGYFDETIRPGKYALITREHHLHEISILARLVLSHTKIAVIIKSQFTRHSTLQLYKSDKVIQEALETGRLMDLCHGDDVRNNVYPTEVARAADICIGNAVGATASLETALCGTRSVMVNPHKVEAVWTHFLGTNIIFSNLEDCLLTIQDFDRNALANSNVGDWSSVIRNFDPYVDDSSFRRIQSVVL